MSEYHFCAACEPCPTCDGGALRYPRRWRLDARPDGELRARCCDCDGAAYLCTAPTKEAPCPSP